MQDFGQKRRKKILFSFKRIDRLSLISNLVVFSFFGLLLFIFATAFLFAWYGRDLPRPDRIIRREGLSTIIYDRNGEVLYDIYSEQNRVPVSLEEISDHLKNATVAIEDKDFYKHQGFSPKGIVRAIFNIIIYRKLQGGSTLTQQLVKNVLLSQERTIPRKIKEFILAIQIERKYSKDEILQMYLNESPYGGTAWGVETAAQKYFAKHAKELDLVESAILAGFPQKPTTYSPFGPNPKAYLWRSEQVLRRLREDGYIDKDQEEAAKKKLPSIEFASDGENIKAPHFVMYVKEQLVEQFGQKMVEQGGLRVTTTLDYKRQEKVEAIVKEEIVKVEKLQVGNGAAVVLDPKTGEILSMVGSKDYFAKDYDGKVNVTLSLRQPGSAIKPITYATAFQKGYTPSTVIIDAETHFLGGTSQKDYVPQNYDNKFRGPVQVRFALGNSINLATVKMLAQVGVKEMLKNAYNLGLTNLEPTDENVNRLGLSITLGGGEVRLLDLISAFGVFANQGIRVEPFSILKVTDSQDKVLYEHKKTSGRRILSDDVCFLISHILSDNNARKEVFGPRSWLLIPGKTVAVKTGTTDDKRDNWTIGYTPSVVVGVWVGNNDNSPMNPELASGVTGAAPIWHRITREVIKEAKDEPFLKPANIIAQEIDAYLGGLPKGDLPTRSEYFIKGTEPTSEAPFYKKLKIASDGKLANELQIAKDDYEEKEYIVLTEKDPTSADGRNRWQEGIDAWLEANHPEELYHPSTEVSTNTADELEIKIKTPQDHEQIDNENVKIEAKVYSLSEIIKIELFVDGDLKKTYSSNSFSEMITLKKGTHKIKVKAEDEKGKTAEKEINIGVFVPWDYEEKQLPTPTLSPKPTLTPTPTIFPSPT